MTPSAEAAAPGRSWTRRAAWMALALVLVVSLCFTVHRWYDPTNDGSMYIVTARALAAGDGYSYLGEPFLIRPPGFSCLLAPLVAWRGNDFYAFNLLVSALGAAGVLGFHFLARARLGAWLALLAALLLWFNPGYQRLCNQVMSDVPGWAALVLSLLLAERVRRAPSAAKSIALGLALGLGALLRSGNLLLVPALVLAEFTARRPAGEPRPPRREALGRCGALVLGALLVGLPWALRNRAVAPAPPADQTLLYSYSSGMWHEDMGDPGSPRVSLGSLLGRFPRQMGKSLHTLGTRLRETAAGPGTLVVAGVLLAALAVALARRRGPEEWFALGTLLVIAFYFGYAGRLLVPVFAFAVVALLELVRDGVAKGTGRRVGEVVATLIALAGAAHDWSPREDWDGIEVRHRNHVRLAREIRSVLPAEARLGAYRGWHHAVYLERPVYSFEHACARAGSPGNAAAIERTIERYGLDTVLVSELGLPESVQVEERAFASAIVRRYGKPELGLVRVR